MKYLCFEELEAKTKTKRFAVKNKTSGFILGCVKWYAPWRKYCFFNTATDLVFDADCLADIQGFITKLMLERTGKCPEFNSVNKEGKNEYKNF